MAADNTYGQFCGLARALDHVGDRWTLLVVRELLLGPKGFREIQEALPGMGPTMLAGRLRRLTADGLVQRNDAPPRSKAVAYALTPAGRDLEPAVLELIRWGARWMASGPGDDLVDARWGGLALRALLDGPSPGRRSGRVHLDLRGVDLEVRTHAGRRTVLPGRPERASARVAASLPEVLAVAAGHIPLTDTGAVLEGDVGAAKDALAPSR